MKPSQRLAYAERIDRVVRHLERRALDDGTPDLAELAGIAAMSDFHFHRIFRLMTGETVGDAVRRIRLARTLADLAAEPTIARAAVGSGYATPQAFARALKRQAGLTPSTARSTDASMALVETVLRSPPAGTASPPITVEVVSVEPFRLVAIRNVGDYAELNHGYARLYDHVLAHVSPEALLGIYGVPHDDPRHTPAQQCRFDCALAIGSAEVPPGELDELRLGGGDHARLRHLGSYDGLPASIDALYAQVIGVLDREVSAAPLFVHYLDDPEEVPESQLRSDIYLPLQGGL